MKKPETVLKNLVLGKVYFWGGKRINTWPVDVFIVVTKAFRDLNPEARVQIAYEHQDFIEAKMTSILDWFQVKCAHKILEELKLFHLVTPLWLAQCGSWAGVGRATRPYRRVEAKRIYDADHATD